MLLMNEFLFLHKLTNNKKITNIILKNILIKNHFLPLLLLFLLDETIPPRSLSIDCFLAII